MRYYFDLMHFSTIVGAKHEFIISLQYVAGKANPWAMALKLTEQQQEEFLVKFEGGLRLHRRIRTSLQNDVRNSILPQPGKPIFENSDDCFILFGEQYGDNSIGDSGRLPWATGI
jgi:hypothetical protein